MSYSFAPLLGWLVAWLIDGLPAVNANKNFVFVSLIVAAVAGLLSNFVTFAKKNGTVTRV